MDTKTLFMQLVISCPMINPHSDCPFTEYRNAPITQLIELSNTISEEEMNSKLEEHRICKKERQCKTKAS